jgi:hypothetical protein
MSICHCVADKLLPEDCDGLQVCDENGEPAADFKGRHYRVQGPDGAIIVYRMSTPRDEGRLLSLQAALVRMNQRNAEYWQRKDDEEV